MNNYFESAVSKQPTSLSIMVDILGLLILLGLLGAGFWHLLESVTDISPWLFGLLCIGGFVGFSLVGLLVVHRQVYQRLTVGVTLIDNGVVGWFFSGMLVIYGITLGLIVVATWQSSSQVSEIVSKEAAGIAAIYRDITGYPSPAREALDKQIFNYTAFIVEKEWPAQRRGEILDGGTRMLNDFQRNLYRFEPKTESQKMLHAEALSMFNRMVEYRRMRIETVHWGAPPILWAVVLVGGVLCINFSYCFHLEDVRLHALLTGGLATMIGLLIFLTAALDRPYHGAVSVPSDAYQLIINKVMTVE
ncbi:DUF4239 domain-containing protein [Crenothrix sp.]|uniref:bestrophin-like domain n=1 Tax=Crenothrix sp. TaxID=3100433 RepID=UPI00374D5567